MTIDFLRKCLKFDPTKRMTVDEALNHPYVQKFRKKETEKVLEVAVKIPIDDNNKLTTNKYREALYTDITMKKKE